MALPYPQVPGAAKAPKKRKQFDPEELARLQEQEVMLSEELDYIRQNNALPPGDTPKNEFLNRNVDIEAYTMQLQSRLGELASKRQELEKEVREFEYRSAMQRAREEDIAADTRTPAQRGRDRKQEEQIDRQIKAITRRITNHQLEGNEKGVEEERKRLRHLQFQKHQIHVPTTRKQAQVFELHEAEKAKSRTRLISNFINRTMKQLRRTHPDMEESKVHELALKRFQDAVGTKAVEPSGEFAYLKDAPDVTVDWETFTMYDPELGTRRRMTREEGARLARERQILHLPKTTLAMLENRKKPQALFDSIQNQLRGLDETRAMLTRLRNDPQVRGRISEEEFNRRMLDIASETERLEKAKIKAKAKLDLLPDPKNLSWFLTPEARPGGVVVENWYQHKLRYLLTFASMGTTALLREASTVTKDPDKPKSEFGYFEILPDAPSILRTKEEGGLEGGGGFDWWNSEAMSAAQATMPMFSFMTKHYPGIVHGGTGTRFTAAVLAGLGDIAMPVGPEALGIVAAKAAAPIGAGISGVAKTGKVALKVGEKGHKFRESVRKLRRQKSRGIDKQKIKVAKDILDKGDRLGRAIMTSGFSEGNKYLANTTVKAMTVRQVNDALDTGSGVRGSWQKRRFQGYGAALNPLENPSTIRSAAAGKVAEQLADSLGNQSAAIKAFKANPVEFKAWMSETLNRVPRGTADERAMKAILASDSIDLDTIFKAFRNEAIGASKEIKDGILNSALMQREKIAKYINDEFATIDSDFLDMFNNRLFAARIIEENRLLPEITRSLDDGTFDARTIVDGATPEQIQAAAKETMQDYVELNLFNRAPNNMIFVTRDLLVDETLGADPNFARAIAEKSGKIYNEMKVLENGDTTFGNMSDLVSRIIITNKGTDTIRRSPKWRSILRNVIKKEGLNMEDMSLVHDQIKSYYAKQTAKEFADRGLAFTGRKSIAAPSRPLETPAGALMTERAFKYASGTPRERRPFSRTDFFRRTGSQTDIITLQGLAKAKKSLLGRLGRRYSPTERAPVAVQNMMKDMKATDSAVFEDIVKTLKEGSKRKESPPDIVNGLISRNIEDQVEFSLNQLKDAASRRGVDQFTAAEIKTFLASQDMSKHLPLFEGESFLLKDVVETLRPAIRTDKQKKFVERYLQTFFKFTEKQQAVKDIPDYLEGFKGTDIEEALKWVREKSGGNLDNRGMALRRFELSGEAYTEAALVTIANDMTKLRNDKIIDASLMNNPSLRFELIPSLRAERKGDFLWNGTYGYRVDEVMEGIISEHRGRLTDDQINLLKESEGYQNAVNSLNRAYMHVWSNFNNPRYVGEQLDVMLKSAIRKGITGLDETVESIIAKDKAFTRDINNASNQLGNAVRASEESKIIRTLRQDLELIQRLPKDQVIIQKQELRELKKSRATSDKAARKAAREKNKETIDQKREELMVEEGIAPPMAADIKAPLVKKRREIMKAYREQMKGVKKAYWKERNALIREKRAKFRKEQGLIRHTREERKRRYDIVRKNVKEFIKREMENIQIKYDAYDLKMKKKHGIPEKMTDSEYDIMRKKYHQESQRYNKETFLDREGVRREEISRVVQSISPRIADDLDLKQIDDLVEADVLARFDAVEAKHKVERAAMRANFEAQVKAGEMTEQRMRSMIYGYNRYKYFDKWNEIDDYTIDSYARHFDPEGDVEGLAAAVRDEMREWDAVWGMKRRDARIEHMNQKRLEWGFPVKDPEKAAAYKKDMKEYAKAQRIEHIERRKKHREAQMKEQELVSMKREELERRQSVVRERMKQFKEKQKKASEIEKEKWKEERTQRWDEVSEGLGLRKPVKGREEKMKRIAEKIKTLRKKLQEEMNAFKDKQKLDYAKFGEAERERLGLKRTLSEAEKLQASKKVEQRKLELKDDEGLATLQAKVKEGVLSRTPYPTRSEFAEFADFNPNIHPLNDVKNKLKSKLEDAGIDLYSDVAPAGMLQQINQIIHNPSKDLAVILQPKTIEKLKNTLKNKDFQRALEAYSVRDAEGSAKIFKWIKESVERMRQIQTGGLLGGWVVTRYAGLNIWSAPALMMMTRGVGGTASDLSELAVSWFRRGSGKETMFVDAYGKPWTFDEIAAAEARNPLYASALAAEMDSGNLAYLMEVMKNHGKYYRGWTPFAARNNVARFADFTDSVLRRAVFRNGLKRGLTEAQAAREAKDALFDYAKARESPVNRRIGQALMFWSFQAESIRALADAMARGEVRPVVHAYRAIRKMAQQQGLDAQGSSYDMARVYRYISEDFEDNPSIVGGFTIPALESFGLLAEGFGNVASVAVGDASFQEALSRQVKILTNRSQFRPLLDGLIAEIEKKDDLSMGKGGFVPNAYVSGMPDFAWEELKNRNWIKAVDPLKRRQGKATRDNEQWKFVDHESKAAFEHIQRGMLAIGIKRAIEDNVIKTRAIFAGSEEGMVPYPLSGSGGLWDLILYHAAVKSFLSKQAEDLKIQYKGWQIERSLQQQ